MIKIYPKEISKDKNDVIDLLKSQSINFEENIDSTFGEYRNEKLIATASIYKNIIKCIAIEDGYKGGSIFNSLMTELLNEIDSKNFDGAFVYTKPIYENSFSAIGFKKIESVIPDLIFMQRSHNGFDKYLKNLEEKKVQANTIGAVVLNANPFTLGHRYLIEYALNNSDHLHIFVVSEDESYFKAKDRYNMVKLGVSDLKNISLHSTENYIVSSATFPSYFIDENKSITKIHAKLDARIFKNYIAKTLDINKRFVGEEPYDMATKVYNETMKETFLEDNDIDLIEIPRKKVCKDIISASKVRYLIKNNDIKKTKSFLPKTSYNYINELIKNSSI